MSDKKEEKKPKLPPRQSLLVSDDFVAEAVVKDNKPTFVVYNRFTEEVTYQPKFNHGGVEYLPLYNNDALLKFVKWPSDVADFGSELQLFNELREFIHKWCDMEEKYEKLAALYVMFTWAYDEFMEVPYLRIMADLGSGKSRLGVQVMARICYKAFTTISASTLSPVFRTLDFLGGTFVLDEADLGDKGDKNSELVQLLNSGYIDGIPVMRTEMTANGHEAKLYKVFGPKIIISREHFKDAALESRCLYVKLTDTKRKDIPYLMEKSIDKAAEGIRNKLLMWRFKGYGTRRDNVDLSFAELDVPSRLKQLLIIVSGIIEDPEIKVMLKSLGLSFKQDHIEQRADSIEGEIVEILLKKAAATGLTINFIECGEIADEFNLGKDHKEQKKARSIGWYLRERIGIKTETHKTSNLRGITIDFETMKSLAGKYGLDYILTQREKLLATELPTNDYNW